MFCSVVPNHMTVFDYVVLGIIGLSLLVSVIRGAVREVFALAAWVLAFVVASLYASTVGQLLPASVPGPTMRILAGFALLFLAVLVVMGLTGLALSALIRKIGLGSLDRFLGALLGLARGLLIVVVGVLLAGLTSLPKEAFWRNAMLSPPLEAVAMGVKGWLPDDISKRIRYD